MNEKEALRTIEDRIRKQHPTWPQEKRRWLARQALGELPNNRR